ncbi:MAG: amidohydrolase family protein [Planctomycetes bacterium]|nr:amidohydrolase family protein [Planctomycetota bacterium]
MFDVIVRGGAVFDGTRGGPRSVDLGVRDGALVELGDLGAAEAGEVLDARGAWVVPGFVDVHTHYDLCLGWEGLSAHCLRQGITSVIGGNCGLGDPDVLEVLGRARGAALGINFGALLPLGPLRSTVVPRAENRPATARELALVVAAIERELDRGALGLSWGPYHANSLIGPAELRACLAPLAARGKPFVVHRRSEGEHGLAATEEAIGHARAAGVGLQISHLKTAGRLNWGDFEPVLECVDAARKDLDLGVDVYPYDASLTYLSAAIPDALKADGGLLARLADPAQREVARVGVTQWFSMRQGPGSIVVHAPSLAPDAGGATLEALSARLGVDDPAEALLQLVEHDAEGTGGWATYLEMMSPAQVQAVLDLGYAAVASDAVPDASGVGMGDSTHPRAFSTYARALTQAAARGDAALAETIYRSTAYPAARFGLARGVLRPGAAADLVVLRNLRDEASYVTPDRYPSGVEHVLVGGRVALRAGEPTGVAAGSLLTR